MESCHRTGMYCVLSLSTILVVCFVWSKTLTVVSLCLWIWSSYVQCQTCFSSFARFIVLHKQITGPLWYSSGRTIGSKKRGGGCSWGLLSTWSCHTCCAARLWWRAGSSPSRKGLPPLGCTTLPASNPFDLYLLAGVQFVFSNFSCILVRICEIGNGLYWIFVCICKSWFDSVIYTGFLNMFITFRPALIIFCLILFRLSHQRLCLRL